MSAPNIDRLRTETTKLLALLTEPEPGLSTWHEAVGDRLRVISGFWTTGEWPRPKRTKRTEARP